MRRFNKFSQMKKWIDQEKQTIFVLFQKSSRLKSHKSLISPIQIYSSDNNSEVYNIAL